MDAKETDVTKIYYKYDIQKLEKSLTITASFWDLVNAIYFYQTINFDSVRK